MQEVQPSGRQRCSRIVLLSSFFFKKTLLLLNPGEVGRGDRFNNFLSPKKIVIHYLKAIILTGVIGMRHAGILVLAHLY